MWKSWINEELLEGWKVTGTEGVPSSRMTCSSTELSFVFRVVIAAAHRHTSKCFTYTNALMIIQNFSNKCQQLLVTAWFNAIFCHSTLRTNLFFSYLQPHCHRTYKLLPSSSHLCGWCSYSQAKCLLNIPDLPPSCFLDTHLQNRNKLLADHKTQEGEPSFLWYAAGSREGHSQPEVPRSRGTLFASFFLECIFILPFNDQ